MLKKVERKRRKQVLGSKCVTYTTIECHGKPKSGPYFAIAKIHDPTPGSPLEKPREYYHICDRNLAGVYQATLETLKWDLQEVTQDRYGKHVPITVWSERSKHGRLYHVYGLYITSATDCSLETVMCDGEAKNLVDAYREFWKSLDKYANEETKKLNGG